MKVAFVVGARPNFIKVSPVVREMNRRGGFEIVLVHTGQHYHFNMSEIFLRELGLPSVSYNLGVGSGTHGYQTGKMLIELDRVLLQEKPDLVLVPGDTNTTLAGALAAYKLHIPLGHIEAGMREFIWRPEEINKKVADHCSDYLFCPTPTSVRNLVAEGIPKERIFHTGDVTYDIFLQEAAEIDAALVCQRFGLTVGDYAVATAHRAETVDQPADLTAIVDALTGLPFKVVFPVHPRTKKNLTQFGLMERLESASNIRLMEPVGYRDFLGLLLGSGLVITDSSGVMKDAYYSGRHSVIMDSTTEYTELVDLGVTTLAGKRSETITEACVSHFGRLLPATNDKPLGDGNASRMIVDIISREGVH